MLERLSFGSNAFTNGDFTLEEAIRAIAREGYRAVNILADTPLLWPPYPGESRIKSIKDVLKETGLVVSGINGFTAAGHYGERSAPPGQNFGPSFSDETLKLRALKVKYTKQVIDLAVELDTRDISISSGYSPKGVDPEEAWCWTMEAIEEALEYAEEKGVNLNIESEPQLLIADAKDTLRILKDISSPNFGVNFDIGHFFVVGEDIPSLIRDPRLKNRINGADIEDIGLRNGKPYHHHLIFGDGVMPFEDIFCAFREIGFEKDHYYTVELYSQSHRPVEAARKSMMYFREFTKRLERDRKE